MTWRRGVAFACLFFAALAWSSGCGEKSSTSQKTGPAGQATTLVEEDDVAARTHRKNGAGHAVIWLGLDGLDWELLDRLASEGKMPNWQRLTAQGRSGQLQSFFPILSPLIWTSAATGVGPDVHRILDFQEVDPRTGQKEPISGFSRAVPAVWNLASAAGKTVGVVGWWATHPAEEVHGFFVSDHASPILFDRLALSGVAFPPSLQTGIERIVAHDGRVSREDLARFVDVPSSEIDSALAGGAGLANPIAALSRILSATRIVQRAGRDLYDRDLPDATFLYFEGTDEIGHIFAADTPPKLACASDADVARYGKTVGAYYGLIDRILGQWMRRAEEDRATLLISSDHGFKWGSDRPCHFASSNVATAAFWHRLPGVFAAWGARVEPSARRAQVSVFDLAPTVLALLDLPADLRMTGTPMTGAFTGLSPLPRQNAAASLVVRRLPGGTTSTAQSSEYARKLLALGYLSAAETGPLAPTGGDRPGMTEAAWNNLGAYERDTVKDFAAAEKDFVQSLALRPDYPAAMFNLAVLYRAEKNTGKAEDWFFRSLAALKADPAPAVAGWVRAYEDNGNPAAARSLLNRAVKGNPDNEPLVRELARSRYRSRDCRGAVEALSRFESSTRDPRTLNDLALFETCLSDRDAVLRLLERSLEIDPNQPEVARTLAVVRGAK